ncbi:MAG: hypothetical protein JXQ71_00905 [Verrucomicrobia bacterium]|nr:hypothetical protein [Verrucomicrobiota bacterium]
MGGLGLGGVLWQRRQSVRKEQRALAMVQQMRMQQAEARYQIEPSDPLDPETFYEQRRALTLLHSVLDRLQAEFAAAGRR